MRDLGGGPADGPAVSWRDALSDFVGFMTAAARSRGTIRLYVYRLALLEAVAAAPAEVTTDALVAILGVPHWSPATRKNVRTAYRTFFGWAVRTGRVPHDPTADLPSVSVPDTVPRPAPPRVVDRALLDAMSSLDLRVDFMLRLAVFGGLRCYEIAGVDADDWDGRRLLVHGKGGKERTVYVHDGRLLAHLDALESGPAFPNRWSGRPITPGHVTKLLSRALPGHWTGHTLRHAFATTALRQTKDLRAVQIALGHARVSTTERYTFVEDDRVDAVFAAAAAS